MKKIEIIKRQSIEWPKLLCSSALLYKSYFLKMNSLSLESETVEVNLRGQCAEPVLTIEARAAEKSDADATLSSDPSTASPDICFRPTSIDLASSVVRVLRNTSPVRCRFRLESVVDKTQVNEDWNSEGPGPIKEVTVTPSEGVLEGLDGMELRWEFAPRQIRRYKLQAS